MLCSVLFNTLDAVNSEKPHFKWYNTQKYYELYTTVDFWE